MAKNNDYDYDKENEKIQEVMRFWKKNYPMCYDIMVDVEDDYDGYGVVGIYRLITAGLIDPIMEEFLDNMSVKGRTRDRAVNDLAKLLVIYNKFFETFVDRFEVDGKNGLVKATEYFFDGIINFYGKEKHIFEAILPEGRVKQLYYNYLDK